MHFSLELSAVAHRFLGLAAAFQRLSCGEFFGLKPFFLGFLQLCQSAAFAFHNARRHIIGSEERQQLAVRYGKKELRIRPARIGAKAVDPQDAPTFIKQRTARIAARDRGGVQHCMKLPAGPCAGQKPAAFNRRLSLEDIADLQPLRAVHIHRITDRKTDPVIAHQAASQRQRGQTQITG